MQVWLITIVKLRFLFGDKIADKVEKRAKEQRIIKKISKNYFSTELLPYAKQAIQVIQEREQHLQPKNLQTTCSPKKKSCIQKKSAIGIQKQKSRSKDRCLNSLMGRTHLFLKNWRKITQNKSVLDIVKGYKVPFVQKPTQTYHPQTQPTDPEEDLLISSEISHLVGKGAMEEVDMSQLYYPNSLFSLSPNVQGGKEGYKSLTFKQIHSKSKIQDGERFTYKIHFETKQFPHQNRSERCIL